MWGSQFRRPVKSFPPWITTTGSRLQAVAFSYLCQFTSQGSANKCHNFVSNIYRSFLWNASKNIQAVWWLYVSTLDFSSWGQKRHMNIQVWFSMVRRLWMFEIQVSCAVQHRKIKWCRSSVLFTLQTTWKSKAVRSGDRSGQFCGKPRPTQRPGNCPVTFRPRFGVRRCDVRASVIVFCVI